MKPLVGEGKPFHSSLDKAAGLLKRKVGTGAEFMKELMGLPGIKQTEIQERGLGEVLGMPRMTHDQFMAALGSKPAPAIREITFSDKPEPLSAQELRREANNVIRERASNYADEGSDTSGEYRRLAADEMRRLRSNHMGQALRIAQENHLENFTSPHHGTWTLPGGENYREMLIKSPEESGEIFAGRPGHFGGEPGILASMRLKDRKGPNGEKLLHLEELQSDWHQEGRKAGYKDPQAEQKFKQVDDLRRTFFELNKRRRELHEQALQEPDAGPRFNGLMEEANGITPKLLELNSQIHDLEHLKKQQQDAVPDAPFKKNWEEVALKRLIHHAAEKGYHGVVVTPGAEQADRYSLAKHIDSIMLVPNPHPNANSRPYYYKAFNKQGDRVADDTVDEQLLSQHIGKEAAEKLLSQEPNPMGERMISGANLVTGDEGMKGFYDKKVPSILNTIGKKYGVKTELGGHKLRDPNGRSDAAMKLGVTPQQYAGMSPDERNAFHEKLDDINAKPLHYFPITEDMRKDVLTNGLPLYAEGGIIHKAEGGNVQPSLMQMKMEIAKKANPINLKDIGVNEAPGMFPKTFFPPEMSGTRMPSPGGVATPSGMPIGGVDTSQQEPGQQLMPQTMAPPPAPEQQGGLPGQSAGPSAAPGGAPGIAPQGPTPPMGNMLSMTPQGQTMAALGGGPKPPGMAKGGTAKSVDEMKAEMAAKAPKDTGKRVTINAEGSGGVKGIVVPRHTLEGNKNAGAVGMHEMNEARAKVYGDDHREPLTLSKMAAMHKKTLADHFAKSPEEQHEAEEAALGRLREAKHIGKTANTLDESEKLDTVRHEEDAQGRTHIGFASKGVAGHALYTTGKGKGTKYNVINTCPGQTEGCGGGKDANGIVDTKKGTCFAPNAESQYAGAAVRRAAHAQAKHDPAMTNDWILAHTGSLRNAARLADKNNKRLLFRPNVVDETDVTSRHAIRHLNDQRKAEGKPPIIANSYGKTNELHDPENGYYVTHSNVGPKVKKGESIAENIGRDKARVRNTIMAADNKGDFKNEQGNKTPPKGSYMVTDVKRGSPMAKKMEAHITHAKYWTTGREDHELTPEEKAEGPEGHFGGNGKPTTPEKAHFGHTTVAGKRFDYQKQHILHPRLVNVPERKKNKKTGQMETVDHMIPTDSRFMDTKFLPENRFKTKNGKEAGHILMTTPTESTSNIGHQTSFTHNVSDKHIEHAIANKGEYEIDKPDDQIKAAGKEYRAPQSIKFYAEGGAVGRRHPGFEDDDFHAFPEQNVVAQRHLAMRHGEDEHKHSAHKKAVVVHKNTGTMQLEMILNKKAK
jgi:hypothetical protein